LQPLRHLADRRELRVTLPFTGDLWLYPAGHPHSIQALDPDGTEFLLVFNQGNFSENGTFLLSEWMAHTPPEVLIKNFGLNREALAKLPTEALYIFPGTVPTNTVVQDKEEIGGSAVASPTQNTFKMKAMAPTRSAKLGEVRIVDSSNFPLTKLAAALVTLKPGGLRELHWHPNSSEWQFWIAGQGRMTVFFPVDNARTVDFNPNDVGYVPSNAPHYIENTGDTDAVFLEMLASDVFEDVSLNQWLRRLPAQMVQAHLGFDKASLAKIPDEKLDVV
jgi:oxalate decarboxylase